MKSAKTLMVLALLAAPLVAASVEFTQEESFDSRELNFREYVALLRSDVKAQRKNIVAQLMQFSDSDAAKFWPIFEQYDGELAKIGEGRVQLIVDYARNYENLTNDQADALMSKAFELEAQRVQLKKKYFDKMKAAVSAMQATKFFLIENQMQHIVDLQIPAGLPVVKTASN
jgi:chaperone required for assembly of F1-ATPase